MDLSFRTLLDDLCFIDGREADRQLAYNQLRRYGKLGVAGPFQSTFGNERLLYSEVASVFAEQLRRLGYLELDHPMDPAAHDALLASARATFEEQDFRRSEVEALIGRPSLVVDKRIACYATADPERGTGWWMDHSVRPVDPALDGIAEQLRTIREADPSQALGGHQP